MTVVGKLFLQGIMHLTYRVIGIPYSNNRFRLGDFSIRSFNSNPPL